MCEIWCNYLFLKTQFGGKTVIVKVANSLSVSSFFDKNVMKQHKKCYATLKLCQILSFLCYVFQSMYLDWIEKVVTDE